MSNQRRDLRGGRDRYRGLGAGSGAFMLALMGCGSVGDGQTGRYPGPAEPAVGHTRSAVMVEQGRTMQGISLQGKSMQGILLQGILLQGKSMQGKTMQGFSLLGTSLLSSGTALAVGTILTFGDTLGSLLDLRVSDVRVDPKDPSGEITLYAIDAQTDLGWENICAPDASGQRWAMALPGAWDSTGARIDDPSRVTLACTSGVIAKCVRWGYKPWKTYQGVSLAPYHQACTRMARADYCGTGNSHTINGTTIDVYDGLGLQNRTPDSGLIFEAAWTPTGAYCIAHSRWFGPSPTTPNQSMLTELIDDCSKVGVRLTWESLGGGDTCIVARNDLSKADVLLRDRSAINNTSTTTLSLQ